MAKKIFYILSIAGTLLAHSLFSLNHPLNTEQTMANYQVIERPSMMIAGITCRTSNAPDAGPVDIPRLWGQFFSEEIMDKIPNKAADEIISLYFDYESDHTQHYTILIGSPVTSLDEIPEGMTVKIIPAGSYAVFRAIGEHPKSLIETWGNIWQTDLKRTYTGDYEVYGEKFVTGSPKEVDIFIAIDQP